MQSNSEENTINTLVQTAWLQSPLVQLGLTQSTMVNQAIRSEQKHLIELASDLNVSSDLETAQTQVIAKIEQDIAITARLNDQIAYTEFYTTHPLTYPLKTNKLAEALQGAKELISDLDSFSAILSGQFPVGFDESPTFPVMLGDNESTFGNAHNTFLSTALVEILVSLGATQGLLNDQITINPAWLDYSAVAHVTTVNEAVFDLDLLLKEQFLSDFTFGQSDAENGYGLITIHSGYAFGGGREGESLVSQDTLFAPEDCSSWIGKIAGYHEAISTADMLNTYRVLSGDGEQYVEKSWFESPSANLLNYFDPVVAHEPSDVSPGDIMVIRRFANEAHDDIGIAGHTGVVVGVDHEQVLLLSYARDMPEIEGFGLKWFDFNVDINREVFFLEAKQPLSPSDILDFSENELAFWDPVLPSSMIEDPVAFAAFPLFQAELEQGLDLIG